jgi:hypothetical protein
MQYQSFSQSNLKLLKFKLSQIALGEQKLSKLLLSFFYLMFIVVLSFLVLLELKSTYQMDVFPFVNTPFDDYYFQLINNWEGML